MQRRFVPLVLAGLFAFSAPTFANAVVTDRNENSIWIGSYGSISGWRPVSRNELILWASPSKAYLVKVWPSSRSLRFAESIGVTRTAGRVTKFDRVLVGGQRLPIKHIQRIDPQVAKAMRYRTRM